MFKQVWGTRPNVDNWRRFTDVTAQLKKTLPNSGREGTVPIPDPSLPPTYDVLLGRLPLTPELLASSNDSIRRALMALGDIYLHDLEDHAAAITTYEDLRTRFRNDDLSAEALFNLYFSYYKSGNLAKAAEMKRQLLEKYPADRFATIVNTGKDPLTNRPDADVTKTYEGVYDLFLEGRFAEAKAAKQQADSIYKTNYWSPQLLYIEAVYHIRLREDSLATQLLTSILAQGTGSPLAAKAENMLQVLSRRAAIEDELTKLQITRPVEDSLFVEPMPIAPAVQKTDVVAVNPKEAIVNQPVIKKPVSDSAFNKPAPIKANSLYTFNVNAQHNVVVVLNKVDVVFVNEARNAFNRHNKEKFYNQPLDLKIVPVNDDVKLLIIGQFTNAQGAIDYIQKTKPIAASQIVPWLKGDKFTFSIITNGNLETVIKTKDFTGYQTFLDQNLPVKF